MLGSLAALLCAGTCFAGFAWVKIKRKCDLIPAGPIGRFFLGILAHVNEFEAAQSGERTKLALKAAKARGAKLGGPKVADAGRLGAAANRARAKIGLQKLAYNIRRLVTLERLAAA
jgi:DNA invertase Pin-like site-specific DNA recombinase